MALPIPSRPRGLVAARPIMSARWAAVVGALFTVPMSALSLQPVSSTHQLPDLWVIHATFFVNMAMGYRPETRLRGYGPWLTSLGVWAGLLLTGVLMDLPFLDIVRYGVLNQLVAVIGMVVYRYRDLSGSWLPRTAGEAVWLMAALAVASGIGVYLGAFPVVPFGGSGDIALDVATWARHFSEIAITANCMFPYFFRTETQLLRTRAGWWLLPFIAGTVLCIALPTLYPAYPLNWLFVVPGIWAGMVMSMRPAVTVALIISWAAIYIPYPLFTPNDALAQFVRPESMIDLAYAFSCHLSLIICIFREDTARLRAEVNTRAENERAHNEMLTAVLQSMSDGLLLTDHHGRVALANKAAKSIVGGEIPDVLTDEWARTVQLQTQDVDRIMHTPALGQFLRPHLSNPSRTDFMMTSNGEQKRLSLVSQPMRMGQEKLTLLLFKDITAECVRQRELESFAGTVAHDLKGPLTALSGWVDMAEEELREGDPHTSRYALGRASEAAWRMRSLIEDYLAYAVSRGGVLTLTDVDLDAIVREITEVYTGSPAVVGTTFEVAVPHVLRADAALTRQLMANIIGNGVKYTREGEAAFIRVESQDDEPGWALVKVSDKGRGLGSSDLDRLFDRFNRGSEDLGSVTGIGLGLALCHAIVARHGGTIRAENNEWGGATFRFTLPTAEGVA